jgi:hypothetical protein
LISVLHYTDISLDDLSLFQNTFVFLDVALGLALLGFALWATLSEPQSKLPGGRRKGLGRRSVRADGR